MTCRGGVYDDEYMWEANVSRRLVRRNLCAGNAGGGGSLDTSATGENLSPEFRPSAFACATRAGASTDRSAETSASHLITNHRNPIRRRLTGSAIVGVDVAKG